jgi:hypothetical protein
VQLDDLRQELVDAREAELPADSIAGRKGMHRRLRRRQAQRITAVAAVVTVLVGAGVLVGTRAADEESLITDSGTDDEVPHLVPTWLPDGAELAEVMELPLAGVPERPVEVVVWTDGPTDLPDPATNWVAVTRAILTQAEVQRLVRETDLADANLENEAYVGVQIPLGDSVLWVASVGLGKEATTAVASTVHLDSHGRVQADLPEGFTEVGRARLGSAAAILGPADLAIRGSGYILRYSGSLPGSGPGLRSAEQSVAVARVPGSLVWYAMVFPGAPADVVEVRGRRAFVVRLKGQIQSITGAQNSEPTVQEVETGVVLFWWETDDVYVAIGAGDEGEARAIAQSLRPVDDHAWQDFVTSAVGDPSRDFPQSGTAVESPTPSTNVVGPGG